MLLAKEVNLKEDDGLRGEVLARKDAAARTAGRSVSERVSSCHCSSSSRCRSCCQHWVRWWQLQVPEERLLHQQTCECPHQHGQGETSRRVISTQIIGSV